LWLLCVEVLLEPELCARAISSGKAEENTKQRRRLLLLEYAMKYGTNTSIASAKKK
jgi:hypothetical protein